MKKVLIIIIIIFLIIIVAASTAVPIVINVRGNIDNYELPDGFSESLNNADISRSQNTDVRIMSANLLVHYKNWGGTDARSRAKMFFSVLDTYKPDVAALQEMSDQWFCCITKNKGSYKMLYPASTGCLVRMTAIIYNNDTVKLIKKGQTAYSQGNNSRLRRIVWGLFENRKTKKQFIITSTHLDLLNKDARDSQFKVMSSQCDEHVAINKKLKELYNCSVFNAGDFNAMDNGGLDEQIDAPEIYNRLAEEYIDVKYAAAYTTHGDNYDLEEPVYDHIFLNGSAYISRFSLLSDKLMDEMSDHYPLIVDAHIN